jgi:hypothetical protein
MRNSRSRLAFAWVGAALVATAWSSTAAAQKQAQGFDLERLYTSAPGGGWFVMDALDMRGGLGGAVDLVTSYAHNPLRITDGAQHLTVVSSEAFLQLGFAATYGRSRLYVTFDSPLTVQGNSGTLDGYTFTGPSVDPASSPDAISHGRAGFDARILGNPISPFRLGLGAQLWVPGGAPGALQSNYLSDGPPTQSFGAYSAMARVLFAGDVGAFAYAGHLGFNLRTLDESPTPEGPQGSELLFGVAGGAKTSVFGGRSTTLVVGPEVYGASAFRSFLSTTATALEGLLTARVEGTADDGPQLRIKLGAGGGINDHFGAPEWRLVFGIELFDHNTDRDKDGVSDRR